MMEEPNDPPSNTEPSVYLDQRILPQNNQQLQTEPKGQLYTVNDSTYRVEERRLSDGYLQFKVYAERVASPDLFADVMGQRYTCDEAETEDGRDRELKMTIQKVSHGIVINSNVFLTEDQWNTITYVDGYLVRCVACEMFTDTASCSAHVERDSHRSALERCRPLAKFDLSIVRKIRNQYHCGVCNETFDLKNESDHFASDSHEEKQLSAINKVSDLDLIDNDGNTNNDCYYFNANAIYNARNNNGNNNYNLTPSPVNNRYYVSNGNENNENYNSYYTSNLHNDDDDSSESESYVGDYDGEYDSVWGSYQNSPAKGSSYATMLKKPKLIDLPPFIEKDLGSKKVKVKFDSYHMLVKPKLNKFWCMVCKVYTPVRDKAEHVTDETHLEILERRIFVDKFGDYFIREVDDKLYHCGHCNNLVLISDMEDHLEKKHSKNPKNAIENTKKRTMSTKSVTESESNAVENGKKANDKNVENKSNDKKVENKINVDVNGNKSNDKPHSNEKNNNEVAKTILKTPTLYDIINISPFGYNISVPLLSYNVILKRQNYPDFYCGLCDIVCVEAAIMSHICAISHIQTLQRTPFIVPFNCNLIRAIREKFHCSICNIPVTVQLIYIHIQDRIHLELLDKALRINLTAPLNTTNIPPNVLMNKAQNSIAQRPLSPKVENNDKKIEITKTKVTKEVQATKEIAVKEKPVIKETGITTKEIGLTKEAPLKKDAAISKDINLADEMDLLNDSVESIDLDLEDFVYVKIKNSYFKISFTSFNTLVHIGDGSRYCFVCSSKVIGEELKKHVESRLHVKNINESKFLDKFEGTLLRQIFLMYHCGICNVLISRKELDTHLVWPVHTQETANTQAASKKSRKNDLKSGKVMHVAEIMKEITYLKEKEPEAKIGYKVKFGVNPRPQPLEKRMKIIIVGGDVFKVKFEHWHSVCEVKTGLKCQLCQAEFCGEELGNHVRSEAHGAALMKRFKEQFLIHLMRRINDNTLHCMICNTEVSNKDYIVAEHIDGKKHRSALNDLRVASSQTSAYTDCEDEVLQL